MFRIIPIISILVLIAVILAGIFLWWPQFEKFGKMNADLKDKEEALRQKQEYFSKLDNINQKLSEYQAEMAKLDIALPSCRNLLDFIYFTQIISRGNGLDLTSIVSGVASNQEAQTQGGIKAIPLSIAVSGSYSSLKSFLSTVYQNSRIIEVKSFSLTASSQANPKFTSSLTLETYYYPPASALPVQ